MKSFFSRFKDCLNADYGGRYFTAIIEQVILENHSSLKILFPSINPNIIKRFEAEGNVDIEYTFRSITKKSDRRRADLAILHRDKPVALLEVKYEDEKGIKNRYQLDDYIRFAKKDENICFTYLTQYVPPQNDLETLRKPGRDNIRHMLYSQLYKGISKLDEKAGLARLLLKFLEETMGIYKTEINERALILLVVKGLTLKDRAGFGKLVSKENIAGISDTLSVLVGNLNILGYRFFSKYNDYFKNRPSIDFGFQSEFNYPLLMKDIKREIEEGNESGRLNPKRKVGGNFYILFNCKLAQKDPDRWLNLQCGFLFEVEIDVPRPSLKKYLYAEIYGEHLEDRGSYKKIEVIPKEDVCYGRLLKLIKDVIGKSIKGNPSMPIHFKKPLLSLRIEIT